MKRLKAIDAASFEAGLAKREVREITHHTQAVDLAETDRDRIARLEDRLSDMEDTLRSVAELSFMVSQVQEDSARKLLELRRDVADSLDDTIETVTAQLER